VLSFTNLILFCWSFSSWHYWGESRESLEQTTSPVITLLLVTRQVDFLGRRQVVKRETLVLTGTINAQVQIKQNSVPPK
jgi:hypothetical protein